MDALDELIPLTALPAALPGTAQYTFGTAGSNEKMNIRGLTLVNTTAAARAFTIHHVKAAGTAAAGNIRFPAITIAAYTIYEIGYEDGEWTLEAGDSIWAFADAASSVNLCLTGKGNE